MSLAQAVAIIESNKILVEQISDLLGGKDTFGLDFDQDEANKFLVEFAQASLEV